MLKQDQNEDVARTGANLLSESLQRDAAPKYEAPQVISVGATVELVQSYSWGDGPDGYTGYYKYY